MKQEINTDGFTLMVWLFFMDDVQFLDKGIPIISYDLVTIYLGSNDTINADIPGDNKVKIDIEDVNLQQWNLLVITPG